MTEIEFANILIEDIEVDDRARKELGDIKELANSIKETGLISPLAVCRQDNGGKPYKLLAGERRLSAKKFNGDTSTPVRIFPVGLSPLQMKSVELHENFYRKDFTWIELVRLQKEIHDLQQAIHGKKVSTLPDSPGWGMADTANLMGRSKASVVQDVQLANAVEQFPDLFEGCRNKAEATKVLKKAGEALIRTELAKRISNENKGSDILRRLSNAYNIGDFFTHAKSMESGMFNLIEIDPPYAIDLASVKSHENIPSANYDLSRYQEISRENYPTFMRRMLGESYRLAAEHSWLVLWFAPDPWLPLMYQWLIEAGWNTSMMCGIWTKGQGQSLKPNIRLANSYEMFFYAWKGAPALAKPGRINTFDYSPVPPQKKIHPTQRPLELMKDIYSTFTFEGSRVLIPCAGSGSGIIAADACKMSAISTDINSDYKDSYILLLNDYLQGR
jgi:DNA modification methylase